VAGPRSRGSAAHKVKVKGDLLARGQLRCRRPLRHLGGFLIALLVRRLRPALTEDVCALAGHDVVAGRELAARVMDLGWEMF
jgi:hypothetical protein